MTVRYERAGAYTLSWDDEAPRCGVSCSCCEFDDGTVPSDHARGCDIFLPLGDCDCDCIVPERQ